MEADLSNRQYVVLKPAQKYLERMQPDDQLRIIEALDTLLTEPETLDIKPLKGRPELRLRVGKYRVLFVEDQKTQTYVITTIGSRGDVYK
ncbi:MAG: type II toxin-antitoxin system RelE family toxin [Elainella sp.]